MPFTIQSQNSINKNAFFKKIDTISFLLNEGKIKEAEYLTKDIQENINDYDSGTKIEFLYKLGMSYMHVDLCNNAKTILLRAIPFTKDSNNNELKGKFFQLLCYLSIVDYDTPAATKYYELSKKYFNSASNSDSLLKLDLMIADMYIYNKEYKTAITIAKNCYVKSLKLKNTTQILNSYIKIIDCYKITKNYNNILVYAKKGCHYSNGDYKGYYSPFMAAITESFMNLKQYDSAVFYFKKTYNLTLLDKSIMHKLKLFGVNKIGAELYARLKDTKKSIKYLNLCDSGIKNSDDLNEKTEFIFFKATIYEKLGNFNLSLKYINTYLKLKEEIEQKEAHKYLIKYTTLYESIEKEKKINLLKKENQEKENLIYKNNLKRKTMAYSFLLLFVFTVLALFIWHHFNNKKMLIKLENLRFQSVIDAQEIERKRIARDLHDGLGQNICTIKMICSNSFEMNDKNNQKLLDIIDQTYKEIRNISHNMMPNTLISLGLKPAIEEMIKNIEFNSPIKFNFEYDIPDPLDENKSISVYRIIQESISNIIKHSKATEVQIRLVKEKSSHVLLICDNGIGTKNISITNLSNNFKSNFQKKGVGLKNILSRTTMLKGKVYVISDEDQGTTIKIVF